MRLITARALWGVLRAFDGPHETMESALRAITALGYDSIELPYKAVEEIGSDRFRDLMKAHDLRPIFQIFSDGPVAPGAVGPCGGPFDGHPRPGPSVKEHLEVFKAQVSCALKYDPILINSHSGRDSFTMAMADEFFGEAVEFQDREAGGALVVHETHRKRFLHSPWVTRDFLPNHPKLKLAADLSHWVNVAETNPSDPELTKVIEMIAPQVYHTHARVGYDHGPQVADPRAPEWMSYTEGHENWWSMIWEAQAKRGQEVTTLTPEHGPPNYQQTVPYTRQPLASIWEINHWIALRQQKRFGTMFGQENTSNVQLTEAE